MKIGFLVILFLIGVNSFGASYSKDSLLMGSAFAFTAVDDIEENAIKAVNSAIEEVIRIESLISSWDMNSETSLINKNAGIKPVTVSLELINLIERSLKVSKITNGYFDISFAAIDNIWDFKSEELKIPSDSMISNSIEKIDFKKIIINKNKKTVFLSKKGMKIGFGAIGKGYAADMAKKKMLEYNIESGVINAGGDLIAWGKQENKKNWNVGVVNPDDKYSLISWLEANNTAIVTSGNYEKFIELEGKKYCHIINPKTGRPVLNMKSVTIVCKSAELADALATTVFVLGQNDGLALVERLKGVECIVINEESDMIVSSGIDINKIKKQDD